MTILSESTCRIATDFGKLLLIIGISCLVASVMLTVNDYHKACVITVIIGLIVIAIFCAFFVENHRRIKVVLSDEYSAKELHDKYKINSRDGEIWELTEIKPMESENNRRDSDA